MRSKFSLQEKYDMIMDCRTSGLSDFQWCKNHDICPSTFYGWIKQVQKVHSNIPGQADQYNSEPAAKPDVVKLEIIDAPANTVSDISTHSQAVSAYTVEISIGSKTSIRLSNDVNLVLLAQIMSGIGTSL